MTGTSWVASAAALVLDVSIGATLLLAIAALLVFTVQRRAPAAARHLAWLCVLGTLLVLPLFAPAVPEWRWEVRSPAPRAVLPPAQPAAAMVPLTEPAPQVQVKPVSTTGRTPTAEAPPAVAASAPALRPAPSAPLSAPAASPGPSPLLVAAPIIWALGMLLMLVRFGLRLNTLHGFATRCIPFPDPAAFELLDEAAARLETSPGIHLLQAPADQLPTGPMTWGIHEPVVVLPPGALLWPPDRMRSVLLHEVAHVQRRDWAGYLLANVACAVYWFHPLVWWAAARLRAESELACDDQVLRAGIPATEYAHALVEIIKSLRGPVGGLKVAISMAQGPQIEQRLRAILDPRRRRGGLSPAGLAAALILSAAVAVPAAGVRVRPAGEPDWSSPGAVPADPETSAAAPRDARVAWGEPAAGLRAGLEWADWNQEVRPGEIVALRVRVRNTGPKPVRLSCLKPSAWDARLDTAGRVTLAPVVRGGGAVTPVAVWLAPGKECFVPGPGPRLRIEPDASAAVSTAPGEPLPLSAGRYQIVAARPLMLQGASAGAGSLYTGLLPLQVLSGSGHEGLPPDRIRAARRTPPGGEAGATPGYQPKAVRPATSAAPAKRPAAPVTAKTKERQHDLRTRVILLQQRLAEVEEKLAELKTAPDAESTSTLIRRLEERVAATEEQIVVLQNNSPGSSQIEEQQRLVNALKERIAQERGTIRSRERDVAQERSKLRDQQLQLRLRLAEAEDELAALGKTAPRTTPRPVPHPIDDPTAQAERDRMIKLQHELIAAETQLAELSTQLGDQHPRIQAVRARVASLKQQMATARAEARSNAAARVTGEIQREEARLQQLRTEFREGAPEIQASRKRLEQLRQELAAVQSQRRPANGSLPEQEAAVNAQLEALRQKIAALETRFRDARARGAADTELNALKKDHATLQKQHSDLSEKLLRLIKARLIRAREGK